MPVPKWLLIAINEYRILTSGIRRIRLCFPFLVIGALAGFVFFIAPAIVNLFPSYKIVAFLLSQVAVVIIQVMLFFFFFVFLTLPITYTLKDIKTEQQWIFYMVCLAADKHLLHSS